MTPREEEKGDVQHCIARQLSEEEKINSKTREGEEKRRDQAANGGCLGPPAIYQLNLNLLRRFEVRSLDPARGTVLHAEWELEIAYSDPQTARAAKPHHL